jgi:hypothetical protein
VTDPSRGGVGSLYRSSSSMGCCGRLAGCCGGLPSCCRGLTACRGTLACCRGGGYPADLSTLPSGPLTPAMNSSLSLCLSLFSSFSPTNHLHAIFEFLCLLPTSKFKHTLRPELPPREVQPSINKQRYLQLCLCTLVRLVGACVFFTLFGARLFHSAEMLDVCLYGTAPYGYAERWTWRP